MGFVGGWEENVQMYKNQKLPTYTNAEDCEEMRNWSTFQQMIHCTPTTEAYIPKREKNTVLLRTRIRNSNVINFCMDWKEVKKENGRTGRKKGYRTKVFQSRNHKNNGITFFFSLILFYQDIACCGSMLT